MEGKGFGVRIGAQILSEVSMMYPMYNAIGFLFCHYFRFY